MSGLQPFPMEDEPAELRQLEPPPDDPIERAKWLHNLLAFELYEVATDATLPTFDRRELMLKFAAKLVAATPNSELHAARSVVRGAEKDTRESAVGGALTHGQIPQSGSLRSRAPKRGKRGD